MTKILCVTWFLNFANIIALIALGIIMSVNTGWMYKSQYTLTALGEQPVLFQVLSDWQRLSLIDIQVAVDGQDCPDGYHPILNNTWYGIQAGYYCKDSDGGEEVLTTDQYNEKYGDATDAPDCQSISAVDPVVQTMTEDT